MKLTSEQYRCFFKFVVVLTKFGLAQELTISMMRYGLSDNIEYIEVDCR